ncbi:hypothetical protein [Cystobacter fuscus]|uniref:hypothetical protein n=1 Tax=Cystobacter fuscus TaxID=43 RepID=UPI002B28FD0B|nr:hypothetical protein F0U63_21110 [Cystobacter fuscus]
MKSVESVRWLLAMRAAIRARAERDAVKFEALSKDPALEREALEKFPDEPFLHQQLQAMLENDRILARNGIFLSDSEVWDEL